MSSVGESSHTDGMTSHHPMLREHLGLARELGLTREKKSGYCERIKAFGNGKWRWVLFISIAVLTLVALVCGVIVLFVRASKVEAIHKAPPKEPEGPKKGQLQQVPKQSEFKFEYESGDKTEEVIINVKENFTELSAKDVTVFNHFRKRVSLHRVEISPGLRVCLVKLIDREVRPEELEDALLEVRTIQVNSSETFVIDSTPVSADVRNDMTVHQFCDSSDIFSLKKVDPLGSDVGMTMEELMANLSGSYYMNSGRQRRQSDLHNGGPYHCGGPIGTEEPLPAIKYTCTKERRYCYRSLVNEQCEECYHGHGLRTRGCWCPINAIQMCIKITYKPVKRFCCGIDIPPCKKSECGIRRPFVPVPVITIKVIDH